MSKKPLLQLFVIAFFTFGDAGGFLPQLFGVRERPPRRSHHHQQHQQQHQQQQQQQPQPQVIGVGAPLLYVGPYPVLALRFPHLNNTVLKFLVDTGANVNTIYSSVVDKFRLPTVLKASDLLGLLESAGVGGSIPNPNHVLLGDCVLEGVPAPPGFLDQDIIFMQNLSAVSLQHAAPACDGLLSLNFLATFPAGVGFDWYGGESEDDVPAFVFYYGQEPPIEATSNLTRVPLQRLGTVHVLCLTINVNGSSIKAILDTGCPVTIISTKAAELAGIECAPTTTVASVFQKRHAEIGDESLMVQGVDSKMIKLFRSAGNVSIDVGGDNGDKKVSLGSTRPVYIGDLPAFELMRKWEAESAPGAILGLDFLRQTRGMLLRVNKNEVWFEEE